MNALASGTLRTVNSAPTIEETHVAGSIARPTLLEEIYRCLPEGIVSTAPVAVPTTRPTLEVFRLIIAAAEADLLIASPYIDNSGVELLTRSFVSAGERGVKVFLLTRETQRRSFGRTAGIRRLAALVNDALEVRDYYAAVNGQHTAAVHAKLLIADEAIGYVGSAEIRRHGLMTNFEMGYVFHQHEAIAAAREAFMAFWEIASSVNVDLL
jgi:phosphatidylserine/phosphatidylglycerophosphate/cardiolipin synthase-like enzyme